MALRGVGVAAAALALLGALGCATTSASTTRELPLGLGSLGAQLDGCEPDAGEDGVVRMRCAKDVVFSLRNRKAGAADEPRYKAEAYGMAQQAAARLVWDQIVVPTEGPSGLVDRARALEPGSDDNKGTLFGVVRSLRDKDVQEVWCSAPDDDGAERCKRMVGAFLGTGLDEPAAPPPATTAAAKTEPAQAGSGGPVTVFGRALSLPTSCKAKAVGDGGAAECSGGGSLTWHRFDEMEQATQAVQATLDAVGAQGEGDAFSCTIAGEAAQCEAHERGVAGVTYIDGKPVAVLCLGVADPKRDSLCKAIIQPR